MTWLFLAFVALVILLRWWHQWGIAEGQLKGRQR